MYINLPTELKLQRLTDSFRRDLKTFLLHSLSTGTKIRIDSVMHPRSSSRRRNTSALVKLTVTVTVFKTGKPGFVTKPTNPFEVSPRGSGARIMSVASTQIAIAVNACHEINDVRQKNDQNTAHLVHHCALSMAIDLTI